MLHKEKSLVRVYVITKSFANAFSWSDKLNYLVGTEIDLNLRSIHSQISQHEFVSHWWAIWIQQIWVVYTKAWLFLLKKESLLLQVLHYYIQNFIWLLQILPLSLLFVQGGKFISNFLLHKILIIKWKRKALIFHYQFNFIFYYSFLKWISVLVLFS